LHNLGDLLACGSMVLPHQHQQSNVSALPKAGGPGRFRINQSENCAIAEKQPAGVQALPPVM
jgi:hypothetical protein